MMKKNVLHLSAVKKKKIIWRYQKVENDKNNEAKTPISIIMDMAKKELSVHVIEIMRNNNLPAGVMEYVLESVLSKVRNTKNEEINMEFLEIQKELYQKEK